MLRIYLADLTYQTVKTNYVVPLNIACLASYASEKLGKQVEITLFKYPKDLEKLLRQKPLDVLGLSNYSWNTRLNSFFLKFAKKINPKIITVMGGPDIRIKAKDIKKCLLSHPYLDYYIIQEGEVPFVELLKKIIKNGRKNVPRGCAAIVNRKFLYKPVDYLKKPLQINYPSPYLTGWLDSFLKDSNMIPLLETNRGCPFGCAYCCWGVKAYSKLRQRSIEIVKKELDYVADNSVGQVTWIFCDSNFGILPRDIEIAKKIRQVMDRTGLPVNAILYHSKNTGDRNIEIAKITKSSLGYIAIQSTDPIVLNIIGRGTFSFKDFKKQISYYKNSSLGVATDILIGLPGESSNSHIRSLGGAFDMGYDQINTYNIRLLPGSKYESDEWRKKYKVKTKFRPIFGAYGVFNNQKIFEIEESVRATKDMSENQLNNFKVIHFLIYFIWNIGIFKPPIRLAQKQGINPIEVILKLTKTKQPILSKLFKEIKRRSQEEWFNTKEEMIKFYEEEENFDEMMNNFLKLNQLYIAIVYQNPKIMEALENEIIRILNSYFNIKIDPLLIDLSEKIICKDLLSPFKRIRKTYPGKIVSLCLYQPNLDKEEKIEIEIYRSKKSIKTVNYHLRPNGKKDLSLSNLCRFLEIGGMKMLLNEVRIIK